MMPTTGPVTPNDPWELLQQPYRPNGRLDGRCRMLLAALDQGWKVEEPVYLRPQWSEESQWVYHFIIRQAQDGAARLITVRANPEIESLVRMEGWQVS